MSGPSDRSAARGGEPAAWWHMPPEVAPPPPPAPAATAPAGGAPPAVRTQAPTRDNRPALGPGPELGAAEPPAPGAGRSAWSDTGPQVDAGPRADERALLLVEDHADSRRVLATRLRASGWEVGEAGTVTAALTALGTAAAAGRRVAIVLLDVELPDGSGVELAARIRDEGRAPFAALVMQTAHDGTEALVRALEAGADDYVTKPINYDELQARLRSQLRTRRLQLELAEVCQRLEAANAQLLTASQTDALTGLGNRRHVQTLLVALSAEADRHQHALSVLLCDVDHFKRINDTWGHAAGDAVLRQLADRLRPILRSSDAVGRWGGEEFLLVLPEADRAHAFEAAERLRGAVGNTPFLLPDGRPLICTVSIGAATASGVETPERLVALADEALYAAKAAGRNRVMQAAGPVRGDSGVGRPAPPRGAGGPLGASHAGTVASAEGRAWAGRPWGDAGGAVGRPTVRGSTN